MKILALEFSSARRSVALVQKSAGGLMTAVRSVESLKTPAFQMIDEVLAEGACDRSEIDRLVVGVGPGSFTGIRLSIALVQGWHVVSPVKIFALGAIEILLAECQQKQWFGEVTLAIDSKAQEIYLGRFVIAPGSIATTLPMKSVPRPEALRLLSESKQIVGPEISQWFPQGRDLFPDAARAGLLALEKTQDILPQNLEPIYLREINFVKAPPPRQFD